MKKTKWKARFKKLLKRRKVSVAALGKELRQKIRLLNSQRRKKKRSRRPLRWRIIQSQRLIKKNRMMGQT